MTFGRARHAWLFLLVFFLPIFVFGADVYTPRPGTPERAAIMDAVRAAVAPELKKPVKFLVATLKVQGDWAFLIATPQQPNGRPFDYSGTIYETQINEGAFDDAIDALLRRRDGHWSVVTFVIGATDVAWESWATDYGAPEAIFR